MLRNYSPKKLKSYLSSANLSAFVQDRPSSKIMTNLHSLSSSKKANSPSQQNFIQKISTQKISKGSIKFTHKNDEKKKYLFNSTAFVSPMEKSFTPSYITTPNEKSFNLNVKTHMNPLQILKNEANKSYDGLRKIGSHDKEMFRSTEEENLSENFVRIKFIIKQTDSKSLSKNKNPNIRQHYLNFRVFEKEFQGFCTFNTLKDEFLKDKQCVSQQTKYSKHSFLGFETVPYCNLITKKLNSDLNTSFQWLIQKNVRELTLKPIYSENPLDFQNIDLKGFQILQHIGSGGFSNVYLAKCKHNNQLCALKLINKDSITTPKKIKMLQNEKDILLKTQHPSLVSLYYAFESKNYIIFGLEYCENGNLYNYLQKRKTISEEQAKYIFKKILDGLEYLHKNNILFRDIKLQNILFDAEGNIKITDFGLSKPNVGYQEISYSYCGSPEYMAPEMLTKQGHSFEVDFYALGILLYELLYGRSPFYASKKEQIFSGIMNHEPTFPKSPVVSRQVKALIKGLLEKNPKRRVGSLKGVKQICGHPWLRNFNDNHEENPFHFKLRYETDNISASELKKIKDIFDKEASEEAFSRYFFSQSYVNENFIKCASENIVTFKQQKFIKKGNKMKEVFNVYDINRKKQEILMSKKSRIGDRKNQDPRSMSRHKFKNKRLS